MRRQLAQFMIISLVAATPVLAQGGRGGMMGDASHQVDMQVFHQLFEHRAEIDRQVTKRADGIETLTESTNPEVTRLLKTHASAMLARVKEARPIHQRDPLFAELFKHTDQIVASYQPTAKDVRVVETSKDPCVVKLLQAHADLIGAFLANGMSEMMKNHPVPERPQE